MYKNTFKEAKTEQDSVNIKTSIGENYEKY